MKKKLLIIIIFLSIRGYAQEQFLDYYDLKGKKTNREKFIYSEKTTKLNDSLWEIKRFRRNGKLLGVRFSRTKNKKHPIGQSIAYDFNDSISSIKFYNKKGEWHGKYLSWFSNRSKSVEGLMQNNKRQGIWKYYHYNGKIAKRVIYRNDSVLRSEYFDEEGKKVSKNIDFSNKKPYFSGGKRKFERKIQSLSSKVKFLNNQKISVNFVIDINGNITNVHIDEFLPIKITQKIIEHIEKIKGWNPAIHNNRRVSSVCYLPIIFNNTKQ